MAAHLINIIDAWILPFLWIVGGLACFFASIISSFWQFNKPLPKNPAKRFIICGVVFASCIGTAVFLDYWIKESAIEQVQVLLKKPIIFIAIDGKIVANRNSLINDLNDISQIPEREPSTARTLLMTIKNKDREWALSLKYTPKDSHAYWVYYQRPGTSRITYIGVLITHELEQY